MTQLYFATHSYRSQSADIADERLINAYLEREPQGTKSQSPVIGSPGVVQLSATGGPVVWGMHVMNGLLYAVIGTTLYSIISDGTATSIGSVDGNLRVSMSDNGTQLVIVNGIAHYVYDTTNGLVKVKAGLDSDYTIAVAGAGATSTSVTITLTDGPATADNINQIYVSLTADAGAAQVFSELPSSGDTISTAATNLAATIDANANFSASAVGGVITVTPAGGTTYLTAASGTAAIYQITFTIDTEYVEGDSVRIDIEMTGQTTRHFAYEIQSGDSASDIASALQASITADSLLTATVATNVITVYATEQEITDAGANQTYVVRNGESLHAKQVWALDGYFIFPGVGTQSFQLSALNDGSTILGTGSITTAAGNIVSACVNQSQLILLCENLGEVWRNTGNADFPFERINPARIERGSAATFSIGKDDNSFAWLGDDRIVYGMGGGSYTPIRISTHGIEHKISNYSKIDDAFAFVITWKGHKWYVLTFPTVNATWVYDTATKEWHERRSYDDTARPAPVPGSATLGTDTVPTSDANLWNRGFRDHVINTTTGTNIMIPETCGYGGVVITTNGVLFTSIVPETGNWLSGVWRSSFGHVLLGKNADSEDYAQISTDDGATWTAYAAQAGTWESMVWDSTNSLLVAVNSINSAVGAASRVSTSSNGQSWSYQTAAADRRYHSIAHSSSLGLLSAVGQIVSGATGIGMWATDPTSTWTATSMPTPTVTWKHVIWVSDDSQFVAFGRNGIATSADGKTYAFATSYPDVGFERGAYSSTLARYVVISNDTSNGGIIAVSDDSADNWFTVFTSSTLNPVGISWNSVENVFIVSGQIYATGKTFIMQSPNGLDWILEVTTS